MKKSRPSRTKNRYRISHVHKLILSKKNASDMRAVTTFTHGEGSQAKPHAGEKKELGPY